MYINRLRRAMEGANCTTRVIHPKCAIEEYARILRSCVWFKPPHPPISVEASPRVMRSRESTEGAT